MNLRLEHEPVGIENSGSQSPLLLVCEHAGRAIPASLSRLGVSDAVVDDHFGWDIGALAVARGISQRLDAELVYQRYSRLVVDCNRPLENPELIPGVSEAVTIPGNVSLDPRQRQARIEAIWQPFQQAVGTAIDRRKQQSGSAILMAVHSFSPVFHGVARPWQICLAYNRDQHLAELLFHQLRAALPDYQIAMNQPFFVSDEDDQTIPTFGEARKIPHVLLEIRNDLLRSAASQSEWADHVAEALEECIPKAHSTSLTRNRPIEPAASVLLIVDVQNYVAAPDGGHYAGMNAEELRSYDYFFRRLEEIVPKIARLQESCRRTDIEVMYCVIESLTVDGRDRGLDYKITGFHVPPGSSDAQVIAPLAPKPDEIVFSKTSSSVFVSTNIDYVLRAMEKRYLIVTGIATDQCVESAVRDACDLGYLVTLVTDACGTYSEERQLASESAIKGYCRQVNTSGMVEEIRQLGQTA